MDKNRRDKLIQDEIRFKGRFEDHVRETINTSFRQYRWQIFFLGLLGFVGRVLLLGNANIIGIWVDSYCQGPQCHTPSPIFQGWMAEDYVTLLLVTVSLGFFFTLIFRTQFSKISARAVSTLYDETTLRTSRLPMRYFDQNPVGRVVTRFASDYGNVFRLFGGPLAEFLSIIFDLIVMVILALIASPAFAPLIALVMVLDFYILKWNRQRLRECRRELSASRSPAIAHFSETVQGSTSIRCFNKVDTFSDRFRHLDQYCMDRKLDTSKAILRFSIQINSMTLLLVAGAGALALLGHEAGLLSVGDTGVFFSFTALAGITVQNFFEWMNQVEEALVGVERMDHLLRMPVEPGAFLPATARFPTGHAVGPFVEDLKIPRQPLSISFKEVSFRYSPELPWVLRDLSFEIAPGEKVGVIGKTGTGKSTLIQALFHFYPVEKGEVRIGPYSPVTSPGLGNLNLPTYRSLMAMISQESVLFKGSLRENLDAELRYSDEQLLGVLKQVGLHGLIWKDGLNFAIEERGRNVSSGEKQLICIARCLLQDAPVVILDEATSSIDPRSEEQVLKASETAFAGKTQLVIAHRLSTLMSCDRVIWLENGSIRKIGSPEEVIADITKDKSSESLAEVLT